MFPAGSGATCDSWTLLLLQILPGVRIIIANPETKGPLGDSHLGEVGGASISSSSSSTSASSSDTTHSYLSIISVSVNSYNCCCCCCSSAADLGAQRPQRQRLLQWLWRGGAAVGPLQLQAELRRHADGVGQDGLPGLPAPHRAHRRQRRSVSVPCCPLLAAARLCTHSKLLCLVPAATERHDALFVVGALEEAMELRGMRYHPIDIETSVIRAHKSIMEWWVGCSRVQKLALDVLWWWWSCTAPC